MAAAAPATALEVINWKHHQCFQTNILAVVLYHFFSKEKHLIFFFFSSQRFDLFKYRRKFQSFIPRNVLSIQKRPQSNFLKKFLCVELFLGFIEAVCILNPNSLQNYGIWKFIQSKVFIAMKKRLICCLCNRDHQPCRLFIMP